ncbi:PspA/IM30 family protein [bacterium]|nr:PspA/IM30 family protein [candidate division CSSED10-310 bacterium]
MFKRLANLIKGFIGMFVSGLERSNPRALIEAEKENLRNQISRFNKNLTDHRAFVERLLRQIKNLENQESDYSRKVMAYLKVNNRATAGQFALHLKTVKEQLEENRQQLVEAEKTYKELIRARDVSVKEAERKIDSLKRMISEAEMMEAQAELQEMASGMISSIGGSGDTLDRVEEYITERRDKAAARAKVAADSLDTSDVQLKEAEMEVMGEQALLEFAAAYGVEIPQEVGAESAAEAPKDLGPPQSQTEA